MIILGIGGDNPGDRGSFVEEVLCFVGLNDIPHLQHYNKSNVIHSNCL